MTNLIYVLYSVALRVGIVSVIYASLAAKITTTIQTDKNKQK